MKQTKSIKTSTQHKTNPDNPSPSVGVKPDVRFSNADLLKVIAQKVSAHFKDGRLAVTYEPAAIRFSINGRGDIIIDENGEIIGASR